MMPEHVYEGPTRLDTQSSGRGSPRPPLLTVTAVAIARQRPGNAVSLRMTLGVTGPASIACTGAAGSNDQVENFDQGDVLRRG
jgi:hypothetical protein